MLKHWVEKHWVDFAEDKYVWGILYLIFFSGLTDEIHEFAAAVKSTKGNPASVILASEQLVKSINLQVEIMIELTF